MALEVRGNALDVVCTLTLLAARQRHSVSELERVKTARTFSFVNVSQRQDHQTSSTRNYF